jgi:glycosyltransferase involved in cell wall biosynthesis
VSAPNHIPVSAYMITFNNGRTVERALKSLHWVDEIVVVDSFSTDATVEIVKRYATRFEQRQWPGFRDQYQYASDLCRHEWRLFIDADEEIASRLAEEMQSELSRNAERPETERISGYQGHRRTFYLGRWIMHGGWVPDHEIRLYHRDKGSWKGDLHAKVHVDGPEADFAHFYYHYTYADISDHIQTVDRYTTTAAEDMVRNGKRFSWYHLFGNPLVRFLREYLLKGGFLDGMPGFIVAVNSMYYVFMKHAKLWEVQRVTAREPDPGSEP